MSNNRGIRLGQNGMVSFMVTLVMMAVITLIIVGFSQVTRRNEREALDRQLSSQAFYAAESGVNVTTGKIKQDIIDGIALTSKTTCPSDYQESGAIPPLADGVAYTCVLVNPAPNDLLYKGLSQGTSTVVPIQTSAGLNTLSFTWTKQAGVSSTDGCAGKARSTYPTPSGWGCAFGLLRIDLVRTDSAGSSANLAANTVTFFLTPYGDHGGALYADATSAAHLGAVPFGTAANVFYGAGCEEAVNGAGCSGTCATDCTVTANLSGGSNYYARVTPVYRDSGSLAIWGTSGGGRATFINSQAVVDVTGKAQDELRRIQTRLSLVSTGGSDGIPLNALASSGDICKHFSVAPADDPMSAANVCQD